MIDLLIFVPACFALNLAFGPNNLLSLTYGAQHGVGFSMRAGIARLLVFVPMIAASALGLGLLLAASATLFSIVKVIGAIYLVWLGIRIWRSATRAGNMDVAGASGTFGKAFRNEGLVALSNPKAILIFAAFFPQFVTTDAYWQSYATLGALFLVLEAVAICAYASFGRFAARFATRRLLVFQRVSGAAMCIFGVLLLFSPQPARS